MTFAVSLGMGGLVVSKLELTHYLNLKAAFSQEFSKEIEDNAIDLLDKVNHLLSISLLELEINPNTNTPISSGWRPPSYNRKVKNAAPKSKHMIGKAVDIYDPEGELDAWCMNNIGILQGIGLYLEHPSATKGWCHLQSVAPKSGRQVFYP